MRYVTTGLILAIFGPAFIANQMVRAISPSSDLHRKIKTLSLTEENKFKESDSSFSEFQLTYTSTDGYTYDIIGYGPPIEPTTSIGSTGSSNETEKIYQTFPVFIWLMGTGDTFASEVDRTWLKGMAKRGFLALAIDYPNTLFDRYSSILGSELNPNFEGKTLDNSVYETEHYRIKSKNILPNAIDTICTKLIRADCSSPQKGGLAIAGVSQGGYIALFGTSYIERITGFKVTGLLSLAVGCPYGKVSNLHPELTNGAVSLHLRKEKRLIVTGSEDSKGFYSESCMRNMSGIEENNNNNNDTVTVGYGYITVPHGTHDFVSNLANSRSSTIMKCVYAYSNENWGYSSVLDWLSRTAAPISGKVLGMEAGQAVVKKDSDCDPNETIEYTYHRWDAIMFEVLFVTFIPIVIIGIIGGAGYYYYKNYYVYKI